MPACVNPVAFTAKIARPARPKGTAWAFLVLPVTASAQLRTRGALLVAGTLQGVPFQTTLAPDGVGSHWLKIGKALLEAARVAPGDEVVVTLTPPPVEPEPAVPADLKAALTANPAAMTTWRDITALARRDWIHWVTSGKKAETRTRRIGVACDKLASGSRRACCFDRSGMYSRGSMGAPEAAQ